jgi:hypothetical protein
MTSRLTDEVSVLAATKSALDSERAHWHSDILVSTIVEILARKGPQSHRMLKNHVSDSWVGKSSPSALLQNAIETASKADLIVEQTTTRGKSVWLVTEAVALEAEQDREWARSLIKTFETDVRIRLLDRYDEGSGEVGRAESVARVLIQAMVVATRSVFEAVQESASPTDITNVELNLRGLIPELKGRIQPAELAEVAAAMALECALPHGTFGKDLLRVITAGQVLHGMVTRADVQGSPPPTALILDTSELLSLLHPDSPGPPLVRLMLETAHGHGCRIIVTSRVEEEWDEQWRMADEQEPKLRAKFSSGYVSALQMVKIAVLSSYAVTAEMTEQPYGEWARKRRSLRSLLSEFQVDYLDPDDADLDWDFVSLVAEEIKVASVNHRLRPARQRETDGISAALVAKLRLAAENSLAPAAWFVARDRRAETAYEQCRTDDPYPLTANARTWLLFYSAFDNDQEVERGALAERMADDIILESFLSVSAAYSPDEMLEIGDLLSERDQIGRDDVVSFVFESFTGNPTDTSRATEVVRARVRRQSDRALREKEVQSKRAQSHRDDLRDRDKKIQALADRTSTGDRRAVVAERKLEVLVFAAILFVPLMVLTLVGALPFKSLVIAWLGWALIPVVEGPKYVRNPQRSRRIAIGEAIGVLILTAIGGLL